MGVKIMKATGIVRRIDDLGRLVIPKELRKTYNLDTDTPVEIFTENNSIVLKKYEAETRCVFCGEDNQDKLLKFKGKYVCTKCVWNIDVRN
jgi:transcriptional pleiotropic regulator of transition state genes